MAVAVGVGYRHQGLVAPGRAARDAVHGLDRPHHRRGAGARAVEQEDVVDAGLVDADHDLVAPVAGDVGDRAHAGGVVDAGHEEQLASGAESPVHRAFGRPRLGWRFSASLEHARDVSRRLGLGRRSELENHAQEPDSTQGVHLPHDRLRVVMLDSRDHIPR